MENDFFQLTIEKYFDLGEHIYEYAKLLATLPKGTVSEKNRGEKVYYYLNYREGNKVKSDYIGSTDTERKAIEEQLQKRAELEEDFHKIKEDRKACEYALAYKGWKQEDNYDFSLYYGSLLVADVICRDAKVIVKRYEKSPGMQLFFADQMSRAELGEILMSRCWDEERQNIDLYLKKLGLTSFNPYSICRKTHGIMLQDLFWFRFLNESFDGNRVLRRLGFV